MELYLKRFEFNEHSTFSELSLDGVRLCFVLEDKDRGLDSKMNLDVLSHLKVHGETAIPYGRYEIQITKSERFSKLRGKDTYLPLLLDVPGYSGVRIHTGNKPEHTEGCLLPCKNHSKDLGTESTYAFNIVLDKIKQGLLKGKVYITISK